MTKPSFMINNVEALYPRLDQPYHFQQGGGKNGQGGTAPCESTAQGAEYTTSFKMTGAQAKELFKAMASAYAESKQDAWPDLEMPFKKSEDGFFIGKAKIPAAFSGKTVEPPRHFDSSNERLDDAFQLTSGSTINLFVELIPYSASMGSGVSLRIRAVQVIKYKEFIAASPFEAQEGFTKSNGASKEDGLDSVFDAVEEPKKETKEEPEVIKEPTVKVSKKKKAEPAGDVDLASMLDAFDD
jgi:hypothetical protein|tara:strand:- start:563 stop:1285 length:723 start_codon:yes stop_codon:yes gene_type:complete